MGAETLFFDLETLHPKDDGESFDAYKHHAGVSVACVIADESRNPTFYTSTDEKPFDLPSLCARLNAAKTVVSYNGESFDVNVLTAAASEPLVIVNHVDLWLVVKDATDTVAQRKGFYYRRGERKLGAITKATLGVGKLLEDGAFAPQKWRDGRVGEVVSYCWMDTELLRRLWHFIRSHGYFLDIHGNRVDVPEAENW